MSTQAMGTRRFVERTSTPTTPARGDAIVVAAGKGGVGTSTVALLLALTGLRKGSVALVDAQEGLAGVDTLVDPQASDDMHGADGAAADSAEEAGRGATREELTPGLTLVRAAEVDPFSGAAGRRASLRRAARGAAEGGTTVVDAGARPVGVLHALSDFNGELVLVLGEDGVSAPAAYALAKLVRHHRPETRLSVIVNRADESSAQIAFESVRTGAKRFLDAPVEWLGHLPEAPEIAGLPLEGWLRLGEHAPVLLEAAVRASARLHSPPAAHPNRTLTLLK